MTAQGDPHSRFLSPAAQQRKQQLIGELASWLGARLSTGEAIREQHGHGEASGRTYPPDAVQEYGDEVVGLMQSIKAAWDPQGILNPGKIFLEGAT